MRRIEKVTQFWQQEDATLQSMLQKWNSATIHELEKNEVIAHLPDLKGKQVLDLASGIGRYTRYFSADARHLVSVDLVPKFVERNWKDHSDCRNVSFLCSDAMDLDFKDHYFDFIFINWLFMYLEDAEVELLFHRIHRWLAPSGMLFFRESCDVPRSGSVKKGYYCHYRTPLHYETVLKKFFVILKEGHIRLFIDYFADPFQCFWMCKNRAPGFPPIRGR